MKINIRNVHMQVLHCKLDVFVQILPYYCSETDYSFCEDSPPAVPGCGFHPQTPSVPPLFFSSTASDCIKGQRPLRNNQNNNKQFVFILYNDTNTKRQYQPNSARTSATSFRFYNVTSLVHSYIVITVFLGLVSGLLLVHSGAFWSFSIAYIFVLSFCHFTCSMESIK